MNFEARKAEIFRRSEERIKKKKRNRKSVLTLCVPLALCLTLGGLYLRQSMPGQDDTIQAVLDDALNTEAAFEEIFSPPSTLSAAISGEGISISLTDPAQLNTLTQLLSQIEATAVRSEFSESIYVSEEDIQQSAQKQTGCQLVLTRSDGTQTLWHLTETALENLTNGTRHPLTASQYQALCEALSIPPPN